MTRGRRGSCAALRRCLTRFQSPINATRSKPESFESSFQLKNIIARNAGNEITVGWKLTLKNEEGTSGSGDHHIAFFELGVWLRECGD